MIVGLVVTAEIGPCGSAYTLIKFDSAEAANREKHRGKMDVERIISKRYAGEVGMLKRT